MIRSVMVIVLDKHYMISANSVLVVIVVMFYTVIRIVMVIALAKH